MIPVVWVPEVDPALVPPAVLQVIPYGGRKRAEQGIILTLPVEEGIQDRLFFPFRLRQPFGSLLWIATVNMG